jgi:hypothetical protein
MSRALVYLYRTPRGMAASERQLDGAPLAGEFERAGETWRALGLGRMIRRWHLDAEIEIVPLTLLKAAADRPERRDA